MSGDRFYRVRWEIDVYASSPKEAANSALEIMRDPNSIAQYFEIYDTQGNYVGDIDLWEERSGVQGLEEDGG